MLDFLKQYEKWMYTGVVLLSAIVVAFAAYRFLLDAVRRLSGRSKSPLDDLLVKQCRGPFRWLILVISFYFFIPLMRLTDAAHAFISQSLSVLLILSLAWLIVNLTNVIEPFILSKYEIDSTDNLRARTIQTQIRILRRIAMVVVGIVTFAIFLMTFSKVRQIGTSILASAGIMGIIVGFAAQRSIATLLAGIQIAFTQPIRLDDVVVIDGEWGRIEEISLTYVVVRIWDLRRLILPINYFLEKPFQNWTRVSAELVGSVYIHVDYTVPVDAVRAELEKIVGQAKQWDGRVCALQVTAANEHTIELRAVMSAPDSSTTWELRCMVREKLISFLQSNHPDCLPKVRAQLDKPI
jgi:small-conductance mechanosensitive channel